MNQNNDQFQWLADHSSDIIHVMDDKGYVSYINPAVNRILGYSQQEMIGQNAFAFVHPDDLPKVSAALESLIKSPQEAKVIDMRIRRKDGSWLTFEVASQLVKIPSGQTNLVVNSRDITERKRLEQMREEFLSLAAHELKTPITVMKLVVHTLADKCQEHEASKDVLQKIQDIDSEIDRLTELINDVLTVTKLESDTDGLNLKSFDLAALIKATSAGLKPLTKRQVMLKRLPKVIVKADQDRIKQVLINLLTNSFKYSKAEGKVEIKVKKSADQVVVSITDEGEGIPEDKLSQVFDKFYQVNPASASFGSGLGLYISKQIIAKHHGQIWVESTKGQGTSFYFSLPLDNTN